MNKDVRNEYIRRYEALSFSVMKKAEYLIKDEISEELTHDQHATLRFIQTMGSCTSTELAEAFFVNKSAISAIINRLMEKGLITRSRDKKDRRIVYLTLSDKGKALYEASERKIYLLVDNIITQFDSDEINSFLNSYEKLDRIPDALVHNNREDTP